MQNGYGKKVSARVITVDKERRRVECALKDGAMVYAAVWEVPPLFRWPKTGEVWTIRQDSGIWRLDALVQDADSLTQSSLADLAEGEARVSSEVLRNAEGTRFPTSADAVFTPLGGLDGGTVIDYAEIVDNVATTDVVPAFDDVPGLSVTVPPINKPFELVFGASIVSASGGLGGGVYLVKNGTTALGLLTGVIGAAGLTGRRQMEPVDDWTTFSLRIANVSAGTTTIFAGDGTGTTYPPAYFLARDC